MTEANDVRAGSSRGILLTAHKRKFEEDTGGSGLLNTLESSFGDIRELVNCRICVHPMYEPYTTDCGHSFCYGCLVKWFNQNRHKKSCPDCRAKISRQPAPSFALRDIAQVLATRAELLPVGETTLEHKKWQEDEKQKLELDRASNRGLFEGAFNNQPSLASIQDHQDNVLRCPRCTWELEDRVCLSCGWSDLSDGGDGPVSLSDEGLSEDESISVYSGSDYPSQAFNYPPHWHENPYPAEMFLGIDHGSVTLSIDSDQDGSIGSLDDFIINEDDDDAPRLPFHEIDSSEVSSNLGSDVNGTVSTVDSNEIQQRQNVEEDEDLHNDGDPPNSSRSPDFIDVYSDSESRAGGRPWRPQRQATRNHRYGLGRRSSRREMARNAPTYRGVNGTRSTAAPSTVDLGNTSSDDSSSQPQPPRRRARFRRMISSDDDDEPRFRMPSSENEQSNDGSSETAIAESRETRSRANVPRRDRERSIPGAFPESFSHSEPSSQAVYLDLTSPTATEAPPDNLEVPLSSRNRAQSYRRTFREPSNRPHSNLPSPRHSLYNPPSRYRASSITPQAENEGSPNSQPVNARRYYERFGAGDSGVPSQRKRLNRQRGHRQPDEVDNESVN